MTSYERSNKRPRLDQDPGDETDAHPISPSLLDNLNDDCLLRVLSYLPVDDLNSVAICSRRHNKTRAHKSLEQTRIGVTIVVSEGSTILSFLNTITRNGWNQAFQGTQQHHVRIVRLERLRRGKGTRDELERKATACRFTGVNSLELVGISSNDGTQHEMSYYNFWPLYLVFSYVKKVDFSSLKLSSSHDAKFLADDFCRNCPGLTQFTWNGNKGGLDLSGSHLTKRLTELCLNDCEFDSVSCMPDVFDPEDSLFYMLAEQSCPRLERLSIKNVTYQAYDDHYERQTLPLSQEMIIKMVRLDRNLRWLCSDLTDENVVMLKQERPEITFVSNN